MKSSQGIYLFLAILVCIAACKKKEDEPDPNTTGPDCKMYSIVRHSPGGCKDSITVLGNLDKMSGMLSFNNCSTTGGPGPVVVSGRSFIYDGDKVYVQDTTNGDKDTLFLEPGTMRILEIHRDGPNLGPLYTRYEYSPNGNLQRAISSYGSVPHDTALYTYENGDLVKEVMNWMGGSDTTLFSYYPDKNLPENGLYTQIFQRYGSAYVVKNAHLLKTNISAQGRSETLYTYEIDHFGNVSKVIRSENGSVVDSTIFRYACAVAQL